MKTGSKVSLLLLVCAIAFGPQIYAQNTSTISTPLETPKKSKITSAWRFTMGGASLSEGKDEAGAAFLWADAQFDYRLLSNLNVFVNPRISGASSRTQERFDDDTFGSDFAFYDFYIGYQPLKFLELRAGGFAQGLHRTSMLVSSLRTFPGAQEIIKADLGAGIMSRLTFQQVIPTSHSLNAERAEKEQLPTFMTQTLTLGGSHFGWLNWHVTGGHFDWGNMPDKVVWDSRLRGNEGSGEIVPGSRFRYGHEGYYGSSEFCICTGQLLGGVVEFQRIRNMQAADNSADAQLIGFGPRFTFGDRVLDLRYRQYFIESDATVAKYNKSRFGNTNREGYNIEANLEFKDLGFSLFLEMYRATTIVKDPNQFDIAIYYLGVETDYAPF